MKLICCYLRPICNSFVEYGKRLYPVHESLGIANAVCNFACIRVLVGICIQGSVFDDDCCNDNENEANNDN